MRKTIIAGNWKMNHLGADAKATIQGLVEKMPKDVKAEVVIAPVFPYLSTAVEMTKGTAIHVAAQNMHWEEKGAFTGEVSPAMLVDIGVTHVILGHSERRTYFNETDETVNKKTKAALAHNLTPIVCCGETLEQREEGIMQSWIEGQIENASKAFLKPTSRKSSSLMNRSGLSARARRPALLRLKKSAPLSAKNWQLSTAQLQLKTYPSSTAAASKAATSLN